MRIEISMFDLPEEVREVIRLQNQRILRLEEAVRRLVDVVTDTARVDSAVCDSISSLADGSRHNRLITRAANDWVIRNDDGAWTRTDEPDWQWERLAEQEAHDRWLSERS